MFVNVSPAAVNAGESINVRTIAVVAEYEISYYIVQCSNLLCTAQSLNFAARCRATELGRAKKNVSSSS